MAGLCAQEVLRQDAWRNALARAQGEKVLDDPKLLRKSIKKEEKQKVKSAKAWQERTAQQEQRQKAKQNKCDPCTVGLVGRDAFDHAAG
jgi:isoaspartyl peptidase/L-asparaginase-like protein (Ntn-hydrolase superfamily)